MLSLSFKDRKFYQNTNDVAYHQFIHIIYGKLAFINFPFALKTEYQIKIKINRIKNRESLQLLLSKKKRTILPTCHFDLSRDSTCRRQSTTSFVIRSLAVSELVRLILCPKFSAMRKKIFRKSNVIVCLVQ